MLFHWQNLNDRPDRPQGSGWRAGRAWLRYGRVNQHGDRPHGAHVEWTLLSRRVTTRVGVTFDADERSVRVGIGLWPLLSVYASHTVPGRLLRWLLPWYAYQRDDGTVGGWSLSREVVVHAHGGSVWWSLWLDPIQGDYGDYGRTPVDRWRRGHTPNIIDVVLGARRYSCESLGESRDVVIPMPEGCYPATVETQVCTWRRPRWP